MKRVKRFFTSNKNKTKKSKEDRSGAFTESDKIAKSFKNRSKSKEKTKDFEGHRDAVRQAKSTRIVKHAPDSLYDYSVSFKDPL